VLQAVIQFGTAIYGKSLSSGASNRFQKLVHAANLLAIQQSRVGVFTTDSSKPTGGFPCGGGHKAAKSFHPKVNCQNELPNGVAFVDSYRQRNLWLRHARMAMPGSVSLKLGDLAGESPKACDAGRAKLFTLDGV
jgi:hypothetical protein